MFEDINPNQPQPTPPPTPEKEWGPWKPVERATGPEPRPAPPTPVMPSSPTPMPMPVMPPEQKQSKRKYILIGIIIFSVLVVLIAGAVVGLSYLTNENANANVVANANTVINTNAANDNANLNQNTNTNLNANANLNANVIANLNQNANVNTNVNLNANAVVNANTNANANLNVNAEALDSDSDGLVDAKELLYGTGVNNPDTDGDGYNDGAEIENLYSPNGLGQLSINDFKTYCLNYIAASTGNPFSTEEIATICQSGAEVYAPILALKIANDTAGTQTKMSTVQSDVQTKCSGLFGTSGDKYSACTLDLTTIITDFGKVE